jgi:hypothetical protein
MKEGDVRLYAWSAGLAGTACNIMTNPLWMVRVRMQSEIFNNPSMEAYNKKFGHGLFSVVRIMKEIIAKEGALALWKGVLPSMLGIIHPLVYFPMYEKMKIYFKENHEKPGAEKLSARFIAFSAVICKVCASAACYPHEVLRSRIQYDNAHLNNK